MDIGNRLKEHRTSLAVVGLGYVGLPLAVAFARHFSVIGFDANEEKIAAYREGHDVTEEVGDEALQKAEIEYSADAAVLCWALFIIVAVPTRYTRTRRRTSVLSGLQVTAWAVTCRKAVLSSMSRRSIRRISTIVFGRGDENCLGLR